jgi:hypothetical protein
MEIKRYLFLTAGALLILFSCKKGTINVTTSLPVVEAYLMPGHVISIKLYQQKTLTDTAIFGSAITGQKLSVFDGSTTIQLTESAKGTYTNSDSTFLVTGKTYTLTFTYLSGIVTAKTTMPAKPVNFATQHTSVTYTPATSGPNAIPDTINTFTWGNPDSSNNVLVFLNGNGPAFPLNNRGNSISANFEVATEKKSVFYATPGIFPYYGHYRVILLSVNQEYIDLIKSNTNRSTSQNLINTPTNIVNGYGIFTAMQADTLNFALL